MQGVSSYDCIDQVTARLFAVVLRAAHLLNRIELRIISNRFDRMPYITNIASRLFMTPLINRIGNYLGKIAVSGARYDYS